MIEKESNEVIQKDEIERLEQELSDLRSQLQQVQKCNEELEKQVQESRSYLKSIQKYGGILNWYMRWRKKTAAEKMSFWVRKQDILMKVIIWSTIRIFRAIQAICCFIIFSTAGRSGVFLVLDLIPGIIAAAIRTLGHPR